MRGRPLSASRQRHRRCRGAHRPRAVELALLRPQGWQYGVGIVLVVGALLVWRRRYPLATSISAAFIELSMPWVGPQLNELATPILTLAVICYTLGRWVETRRGLVGIGLLLLMFLIDYGFLRVRAHDVTDVVFVSALTLPPYVFGRISRKLALQSALLERQQELVKRQAIRGERDRIARELHDVIAHSLSAMVVQTAAAQDLVQTDPDRAGAVLAEVASTGRRALAETGRLLHVIRDDADELGLAPAPGLAQLDELVQEFRSDGLQIDLAVERPLPIQAGRRGRHPRSWARRSAEYRSALVSASWTIRYAETSTPTSDSRTVPGSGLGLHRYARRADRADRARTGGLCPDRSRAVQRPDRGTAGDQRGHRQDPRQPDPHQAGADQLRSALVLAYESGLLQPGKQDPAAPQPLT